MTHDAVPPDETNDPVHQMVGAWLRETDADPRQALAQMHAQQMATMVALPRPYAVPSQGVSRWNPWYAATALLLAASGVLGVWHMGSGTRVSSVRDFATPTGSRAWITLRDGTRLMLGPETHLRVPADFGRGERAIELDGEALFSVIHDARHPFAVHTRWATVRDVGTTFSVRAYRDDADERITVSEGEVAIGNAAIHAGSRAIIRGPATVAIERQADVTSDLAWSQGGLVFRQTPLSDVVRELARVYGLTITIADSSLRARTVTATFTDEPAEEVLEAITRTIGAEYVRTGKQITVTRRTRPVMPAARRQTVAMGHDEE